MKVRCAQCSGAIPLERDDAFLTCPFCGSTLFLDRATTFIHFALAPSLGEARARDLLAQELARREISAEPAGTASPLRLPFWAVRGPEGTTTQAAFSPLPVGLEGFRIPAVGMSLSREDDPFENLECAETAAARWEESGAPEGLALFSVPFFRLAYGRPGGQPYEAWVEAAAGQVFLGETPPPDTGAINRRSMWALCAFLAFVAAESVLIPSPLLSLILAGVLVGVAIPLLRSRFGPGEAA